MKKLLQHWSSISRIWLLILIIAGSSTSCKKLIEVPAPSSNTNGQNVYEDDATAVASVTGIYAKMSASIFLNGGASSLSLFGGLAADELIPISSTVNSPPYYYYQNALTSKQLNSPDFWSVYYQIIYNANAAIDGLNKSNGLSPSIKQQLLGEVKFMRAFSYFYLVNLYGDVPLIQTTDYKANTDQKRSPQADVYKLITSDLLEAKSQLSDHFLDGTLQAGSEERIRPIKAVAEALLARVYLYQNKWAEAEAASTDVINSSNLFQLVALNDVFLKNSKEAIWQLQPVIAGQNTPDAWTFVIPATGPDNAHPVYLNNLLLSDFEASDLRKTSWISSVNINGSVYYFAFKYKNATLNNPVTEYEAVFRLAEQYLIRAEAKAQQSNLNGALTDLNIIRRRAVLPDITSSDQNTILSSIAHERRVELFSEWGHRWLDLKRTGKINAVMQQVAASKNSSWSSYKQYFPIALSELQAAPNLTQTTGY